MSITKQEIGRTYLVRMEGAVVRSVSVVRTEVVIDGGVQLGGPIVHPEAAVTDLETLQGLLGDGVGAALADVAAISAALETKEGELAAALSALGAAEAARTAAEEKIATASVALGAGQS